MPCGKLRERKDNFDLLRETVDFGCLFFQGGRTTPIREGKRKEMDPLASVPLKQAKEQNGGDGLQMLADHLTYLPSSVQSLLQIVGFFVWKITRSREQ